MNNLLIKTYSDTDDERWDELCHKSCNGTFLHTRKYLSYHEERFVDQSVVIEDKEGGLLGLFPAATHLDNEKIIVSHPGITYGGIVHNGKLYGDKMIQAFEALIDYYRTNGFDVMQYKVVPSIYHRMLSNDDSYALFRLNARRYRCDLSATIGLWNHGKISSRRKRSLAKAKKNGLVVQHGVQYIEPLWMVLSENLERKHQAKPVHTITEIKELQSRFPENIQVVVALKDNQVVAGVILFVERMVEHAQYIASSEQGYQYAALDLIFMTCIEVAKNNQKRYFDFGISNEKQGQFLNNGLYQFKHEFGAGSVVHEFYEILLRK
jgi:hypothetical protein